MDKLLDELRSIASRCALAGYYKLAADLGDLILEHEQSNKESIE